PRTNRLGYLGYNWTPRHELPITFATGSNPRGSSPTVPAGGSPFSANHTYPFSIRPRFEKFGSLGDPNGYGVPTTDGIPQRAYEPQDTGLYLGMLWENTNNITRVRDPDGTFRIGDGGFSNAPTLNPMEPIARFRNPAVAFPDNADQRPPGVNP